MASITSNSTNFSMTSITSNSTSPSMPSTPSMMATVQTTSARTTSANIIFIASTSVGALLLFSCTVVIVLCKRSRSCTKLSYIVEVQPVSPTTTPAGQNEVQDSPIFCEVDIFQFPSSEPRLETSETVEEEVDEHTDVDGDSEDEYLYPENSENEYETMNPPQASEEYAYAYDHVNINDGFMNVFEDNYEYPLKSMSSVSENEYDYAYDWRIPGFREAMLSSRVFVEGCTPLDKDTVDDNFYGRSYQTLSRENPENENEPVPLEYVTVL